MKNFYDITAINTDHALTVTLAYRLHGRCVFAIRLNDQVVESPTSEFKFDLLGPIRLEVELKDFDEGTSGVEIDQFSINGLEVLPKYQHLSTSKNCYVDKLGIWQFEIPIPFYRWYHQITGQGWIA